MCVCISRAHVNQLAVGIKQDTRPKMGTRKSDDVDMKYFEENNSNNFTRPCPPKVGGYASRAWIQVWTDRKQMHRYRP